MPRFKLRPAEPALTEAQAVALRIWFYGARTVEAKSRELNITPHTLYDCVFYRGAYARQSVDANATSETFHVEPSGDQIAHT